MQRLLRLMSEGALSRQIGRNDGSGGPAVAAAGAATGAGGGGSGGGAGGDAAGAGGGGGGGGGLGCVVGPLPLALLALQAATHADEKRHQFAARLKVGGRSCDAGGAGGAATRGVQEEL